MRRLRLVAWLACGLCMARQASTQPRDHAPLHERMGWPVPDYVRVQTGGWIGMATVGLGWSLLDDDLNTALYYGWVPASVGGTTIHTLAWHATARPWSTPLGGNTWWTPFSLGCGALFTTGRGFFITAPEEYDWYYYLPTAVRLLALAGTEASWYVSRPASVIRSHGLVVDVAALDVALVAWARNSRTAKLTDALSLSIGYRAGF